MIDSLLILLKSGIPIAATSFVLVWWALRKDYLGGAKSLDEYEQWTKAENQNRNVEKQRRKQAKRNPEAIDEEFESVADDLQPAQKKFDPLHSKWMEFGGGFYGVVALFTYALVELGEIRDLFANFGDLFRGDLVRMIVQFFVESLKNFVTAITWPVYWLERIHGEQWLWVIGAYGGYWLGAKAAFRLSQNQSNQGL
jgi:hypothetical protein